LRKQKEEKMAQAKPGDTVKVHYTGKLEDGTVFDTSTDSDPLQFTIGDGQIIPGFEQAVVGMNSGESKTIKVPVDEAYGPHREEMVLVVDRNQLPADLIPEVGQQLQNRQPDGQTIVVTVTDVSESSVTVDANHPLAGKDLTFDIQLVEIV
jgi:peptidylprolyl isomerase